MGDRDKGWERGGRSRTGESEEEGDTASIVEGILPDRSKGGSGYHRGKRKKRKMTTA